MTRLLLLLPLVAMACAPAPMTPERARRSCLADVGQADGVSGNVGVGIGSGGRLARGDIMVTSRVFNPQTPEDFVAACTARRLAGEPEPTTFGISIGGRT